MKSRLARSGTKLKVKVINIVPDEKVSFGISPGYVTVEIMEGIRKGETHCMINGSVQSIPDRERIIGNIGFIVWDRFGAYNGWRWIDSVK